MTKTQYLLTAGAMLAVLGVMTAGCGGAETPVEAARPGAGSAEAPIAIETVAAVDRNIPLTLQVTGAFAADEVSDVAAEVSGMIAATPVDVGDRVAAGAVLVRLRTTDASLRLEQASATLQQTEAAAGEARERHNLARANAGRYTALAQTGIVSRELQEKAVSEAATTRQAVATAEAAIAEARSRVALAQKALADTTVRAPFAGFITARPAAVGEYVTPASTVATVMKLDPIRLRLQVPELEAARLRVGQTVIAAVEALDNQRFDGRIAAINPALDPATRATIVEALIANPAGAIRAGMFATAQIDLGHTERAIFVPRAAVVEDPNTNSFKVFAVDGRTARLRVIQPGPEHDGLVRVVTGIAGGEHVATTAIDRLFDGAAVHAAAR